VPSSEPGLRCPVLDAGKGEVFIAAYDESGDERWSPRALPLSNAALELRTAFPGTRVVALGEFASALTGADFMLRSELTDLPHAVYTARLGARAASSEAPIQPLYLRAPNAVLPVLPPNPLAARHER